MLFFLLSILLLSFNVLLSQKTPLKITFDALIKKLQTNEKLKLISIAGADNEQVLKTIRRIKDMKIADSILVGVKEKIIEKAKAANVDISDFQIIDVEDDDSKIALEAVKLVHDHKADMYMKGSIQTRDILRAILNKNVGLRTHHTLSMSAVFEIEGLDKTVIITDPSVIPYPTLDDKVQLIKNAVFVANALGIESPKVAALTAIEFVNPLIKETVEALELTKMNEQGDIKGCIVDGPLSLDLAIDKESAKFKNAMNRKIVGDADILLFPDIHSANFINKVFTSKLVKSKSGTIIAGTTAPVILTSRSDSENVKFNSIILASIYAEFLNEKNK